jgi:hypothetical protein
MAKSYRLKGVTRVPEREKKAYAVFSEAEIDPALSFSVKNSDGIISHERNQRECLTHIRRVDMTASI